MAEPNARDETAQQQIGRWLGEAGFALPGTFLEYSHVCGKPNCRCMAAPPQPHVTRADRTSASVTRLGRGLAGAAVLALVLLGSAHGAAAATATSQPTQLTVTLSLPGSAATGEPYRGTISATARGLVGCYRWEVAGLPAGLRLSPSLSCVTAAQSSSPSPVIDASVSGRPVAPKGPSFTQTVTVTLEAVGQSAASASSSGPVAGEATATVVVLPPEWASSTASDDYAGTTLSYVSCVAGPSCWVVGTSQNPSPPPPTTPSTTMSSTTTTTTIAPAAAVALPGETGTPPVLVAGTIPGTSTKLSLVEGGTFVASIEQISPLRLGIVRTAIPLAVAAISCPEATTCVMVGSVTDSANAPVPALLLMTDAGATWNAQTLGLAPAYTSGQLVSVSCPSSTTCVAVGNVTTASSTGAGFTVPITLRGSGSGETASFGEPSYLPSLAASFTDVSCANSSDCIAVGASSSRTGTTGSALILATTNGGSSWRDDQQVGPDSPHAGTNSETALQPWTPTVDGPLTFGGIGGVGCAPGEATNSCEVSWHFWPAVANTPDGIHWYSNTISAGAEGSIGSSISCPAKGRCFGVTTLGFICAYDTVCEESQIQETIPSSAVWKVGIAGEGPSYRYDPELSSISCPSVATCVAVGSWSPRSGSSWSPAFPLVMSPQLAIHPFFRPPPPPATLLTWTNAGILLGLISLITGWGEVADVLGGVAAATGMASVAIGAMTTTRGNALGWASVALGVGGLVFYSLSLASSVGDVVFGTTSPTVPGVTLPSALGDVPTPASTGEGLVGADPTGFPPMDPARAIEELMGEATGIPPPTGPGGPGPGGGDDG